MDTPSPPSEAAVGLLAGLALLFGGCAFAVALDPGLRSVPSLAAQPLVWVLASSPLLLGGLGWVAGDQRRARDRSFRQYQQGVEVEFREVADREWVTRAVVRSAFDAVLILDPEGRVIDANPTAGTLFGAAPDELLGRAVTELLPDHASLGPEEARPSPGGGPAVWSTRARRTDGSWLPVDLHRTTLEEPRIEVCTVREASTREQLEASRSALARRQGQEMQESRRRGLVLLDVDQGLRDGLMRILNSAEALRTTGAPVEPILVASWEILDRLERLFDLTMWERTASQPTQHRIPVVELFDHVSALLAPLAQRYGRTILVDVDPELGDIATDPSGVAGAVRTLTRQALRRGTGDLVLEVTREAGRDHDWLAVFVGLGVMLPEAETLQFTRVLESSPPHMPDGEQADLALGQRLARHLGGRITVRPDMVERGTTFGLVLPLPAAQRTRPSRVPVARSTPATPAGQ